MTNSSSLSSTSPVLVLGATGSFAGAVAAELLARGQSVRALVRDPQKLINRFGKPRGLEIIQGDVQDKDALAKAAAGCDTIVHGVNYEYHQWFPHMETATANILSVARKTNALVVFPGNVYSLGEAHRGPFSETADHNPITRKGNLRRWMEDELKLFAQDGGRVLIMRAGDYFGPTARNGYLDPIFGAAAQGKMMTAIGNLCLSHQWAYVPDLARATVDLMAKQSELSAYEIVNFEGTVTTSQREFFSQIALIGQSPNRVFRLPWSLLSVVALFSPLIREVMEKKYLWESTVLIKGPRFKALLPDFQPTPLDQAVAQTLESYRTLAPMQITPTLVSQNP